MSKDSPVRARARVFAELALLRFWRAFVHANARERGPGGVLHGLPPGRIKVR